LPARVEKVEGRVVKEKSKPEAKKTKPKNVLVVDDEEDICKMMEKWLSAEGHKVKWALDGEETLKLVVKERFDVVFLDVIMPGIPSLITLFEIKRISPETKVVMITGRMLDKEFKKELKKKGAPGLIQKPFKLEDILGFLK
jgi:DNA-binding NtrC family response regulator